MPNTNGTFKLSMIPCRCSSEADSITVIADFGVRVQLGASVRILREAEVCIVCGVAANAEHSGAVTPADIARVRAKALANRSGSAEEFRFPFWGDKVVLGAGEPLPKRLLDEWTSLEDEDIIKRIAIANGFAAQTREITPRFLNITVRLNIALAVHLIKNHEPNHIRFATLVADTLSRPDEVWALPSKMNASEFRFLKRYSVGRQAITHLVVVDPALRHVRTAYALSGDGQAHKKRQGQLIFAAWI